MTKQQQNSAAIYCRLSRDDGGDAESNSISTQKMMLRGYAKEHGFSIFSEYVDDGISGTTFERASFKRMIDDIEEGNVGIVLCKDLSRLGRNNALVAYYTELFFPDRDIRFIAVNDQIDSAVGDNEIMGFKSIINEFYARDISKKIKSSKRVQAQKGEFSGYIAPLGYRKSPEDKHKLIVDEKGAEIVRLIFRLAVEGNGTTQIMRKLNEAGTPTPREHFNGLDTPFYQNAPPKFSPEWNPATVRYILRNRAYLGSVVNGRTATKSFKNQRRVQIPEEQQIIVEGMHPALVSERDFELAQRVIKVKQRAACKHHDNMFVGLLRCADCGGNLSYALAPQTSFGGYFMCNRYRYRSGAGAEKLCSMHYTPMNHLADTVLARLRHHAAIAKAHEHDLQAFAQQLAGTRNEAALRQTRRELERLQKRYDELDVVIRRLFEQNTLGAITDERFLSMSAGYDEEQAVVKEKFAALQSQLNDSKAQVNNLVAFYTLMRRYADIETLDRGILNETVDHILVHSGEGKSPTRTQKLEIFYRFAGKITETQASSL